MGKFEVMAKGALPIGDTGHQARADKDQQPTAATIILVVCTYCWGLYVAIAAVSACVSAMGCRIIHYITMKERMTK